jgi:hypothetical protein
MLIQLTIVLWHAKNIISNKTKLHSHNNDNLKYHRKIQCIVGSKYLHVLSGKKINFELWDVTV